MNPNARQTRYAAITLIAGVVMTACKQGPDYERPDSPTHTNWSHNLPTAIPETGDNDRWWTRFNDPALNALITEALTNNRDLRVAAARVRMAEAVLLGAESSLLPTGTARGSAGRGRNLGPGPYGYSSATGNHASALGSLAYEVDLWGANERSIEAAAALANAAAETRRAAEVSLAARVAETYFRLLALDEQQRISQDIRDLAEAARDMAEKRFAKGKGVSTRLDIIRARTQVQTAEAAIAAYRREIPATESALCLLLGAAPRPIVRAAAGNDRREPPPLPAGLPSELLLRRPDIIAAEQRLIAANANIGVARAALFPGVTLTAEGGFQSREFGNLFTTGSRAWAIGPSVSLPIFNRDRLHAGVAIAEAERDAAVEQYRHAIITAFGEVETALAGIDALRRQVAIEAETETDTAETLRLSRLRHDAGMDTYTDVLLAQEGLFNARIRASRTREALRATHSRLFAALCGGWNPPAEPSATPPPQPTNPN